jgi:hypothetical protein
LLPVIFFGSTIPEKYTLPIFATMTALPISIIFSSIESKYGIKRAAKGLAMYFWFLFPGYYVSFMATIKGLVSEGEFNVTDKSNLEAAGEKHENR